MGSLPFIEGVWLTATPSTPREKGLPPPPSPLAPFQQRSSNRSPVESPPVHKKALMRVSPPQLEIPSQDRFFGQHFDDLVASVGRRQTMAPLAAGGKENASILKRSQSGREAKSSKGKRRVDFEPSVQVFHFDKVAGDHVSSGSQRLSLEPKDRREFMNRTFQKKFKVVQEEEVNPVSSSVAYSNAQRVTDLPESKSSRKFTLGADREPPLQYNPSLTSLTSPVDLSPLSANHISTQSPPPPSNQISAPRPLPAALSSSTLPPPAEGFVAGSVDFTFFEDEARRLRIKFTIPLGEGVAATDVLVKANMTGNKVRVVASRTVGGQESTQREEFSERYLLPMEVDPYLITARLDSVGNLYVEAPIMTAERKRALAAEKQSKMAAAGGQANALPGFSL